MRPFLKNHIRGLIALVLVLALCGASGGWLWWRAQQPLIPEGTCRRETLQDMKTGEWRCINFEAASWGDLFAREQENAVKDLINSLPAQQWWLASPNRVEIRFRLVLSNCANGGQSGPAHLAAVGQSQFRVVDILDDGIWIRGEDVYYRCEGAADRVREVYNSLPVAQEELCLEFSGTSWDPDSLYTVEFDLGWLYQYDRREKVFSLLGI